MQCVWLNMVQYGYLLLAVLFVSISCSPPSVTKRYRPDYEYDPRTDAFYKLHIEARRGDRMKTVCAVEGALPMVAKAHEDLIQAHGMLKRFPDLGQYVWVSSVTESNESEEEPAIINMSEEETHTQEEDDFYSDTSTTDASRCIALTRAGSTVQLHCSRSLPFFCKVEAKDAPYDHHCDVYATNYQYNSTVGSCYSIRRWVASWDEAYAECRSEGAHLVVLNSEAEMEVVKTLMQTTPRVGGAKNSWYYYAGFRANKPVGNEEVVYRTIFNQTLSEAGYDGWSPGEPNNLAGTELCGTLLSSDGKLNDATCYHLYAFICEKEINH